MRTRRRCTARPAVSDRRPGERAARATRLGGTGAQRTWKSSCSEEPRAASHGVQLAPARLTLRWTDERYGLLARVMGVAASVYLDALKGAEWAPHQCDRCVEIRGRMT